MSEPWMKFYPTDWRSDPRLRMCGLAARGLWIEMLAIMHEAEPYGHLLVSTKAPTNPQLAVLCGTSPDQVTEILVELESAGVFSRTSKGVIYSRRMTRDRKKAETARKNGKDGGNPSLWKDKEFPPSVNPPLNPTLKGEDKPQKPEARYQTERTPKPPDGASGLFSEFWVAYPPGKRKTDRPKAKVVFDRIVAGRHAQIPKTDASVILAGVINYARSRPDPQFIPLPTTWLNGARWEKENVRQGEAEFVDMGAFGKGPVWR